MHDRGLGVELNKAKMLSWLLWADECPTRDDEIDVREEQNDMRGFYGMTLSDDVKDDAWALFNRMCEATPVAGGTNAKRRRRPSVRRQQTAH